MLDRFFTQLKELLAHYREWTEEVPKKLVINPDILRKLAKIEGFYQRPELQGEITAHSPVVRYFKLGEIVVLLDEDWAEKFLHFE